MHRQLITTIARNELIQTAITVVAAEITERGAKGLYDHVMDTLADKIADRLIEAEKKVEKQRKNIGEDENVVRLRCKG